MGLEPTTSRLTAERVYQLSYPGTAFPDGRLRLSHRLACRVGSAITPIQDTATTLPPSGLPYAPLDSPPEV